MAMDDQTTEALITAYIDGMLDDEQRRAVEQSLAKNPKHAELVDQLRRARALVAGLPREQAPPDMCDEMLGQLERSALLDPAGISLTGSGRTRPLALAAGVVLLLAGGLIAFVIFGLPESNALKSAETDVTMPPPPLLETSPQGASANPGLLETPASVVPPVNPAAPQSTTPNGPATLPDVPLVEEPLAPQPVDPQPGEQEPQFRREMFVDNAWRRFGGGALPGGLTVELPVEADQDVAEATEEPSGDTPRDTPSRPRGEALTVLAEAVDSEAVAENLRSFAAREGLAVEDADPGVYQVVLTRAQLTELVEALVAAESVTLLNAGEATAGPIAAGETLRVELLHPDDPAQAVAVEATVGEDGRLSFLEDVPIDVAPMQAAGATEEELAAALEQELADEGALQVNIRRRGRLSEETPAADPNRVIAPGDELLIGFGDVKEVVAVRPDGTVALPELDPIFAGGFKPQQLANLIDFQYREAFLGAQPDISVAFADEAEIDDDHADQTVSAWVVIRPPGVGGSFLPRD